MPSRRMEILVVAAIALVVAAPNAAAQEAAAPAMPPVVVEGGGGAAPPADPNAPAPGAQPAAPDAVGELPNVDPGAADPADVAADAAGIDPNAPVEEVQVGGDEVVEPIADDVADDVPVEGVPIEVEATPDPVAAVVTPMPTVDGGGTDGAAAGGANAAPVAAYQPSGTLPFTGATQNLLLAVLAGMFVPIGVLLYSAARHGDLRSRRRRLAMPRFQWASSSHVDGSGALRPRQELHSFDWTGAGPQPTEPPFARLG